MPNPWPAFAVACVLQAAAPLPVDTTIVGVRLHPKEAWITRAGTVQVPAGGPVRILIAGLPGGLGLEDLRISARGPAGTRLGDLALTEAPLTYQGSAEYQRLGRAIEDAKEAMKRVEERRSVLQAAHGRFEAGQAGLLRTLGQAWAACRLQRPAFQAWAEARTARALDLASEEADLDAAQADLQEREADLENQIQRLQQEGKANPLVVTAELDASRPGPVEVFLAYRTEAASWSPAYEARLSPDRSRLELVLFAAVRQDTHALLRDVTLDLLSQAPTGGLDLPAPPALPALTFHEGAAPKASAGGAQAPAPAPAPMATLRVPGKVTVAAGVEQRFRIASLDLTPGFRYQALPRMSPEVHLMALVTPPPGFTLVPGSPVDLLQGSERLGRLTLEAQTAGEPLRLNFGPVPGLTASLERIEQHRAEVGDKAKEREWVIRERLAVASTLTGPVDVDLVDRTVTSGTASVTVDQAEGTTPGWTAAGPGLRGWTLRLAPGAETSVTQRTRIRGPLVGKLANLGDLTLEGN